MTVLNKKINVWTRTLKNSNNHFNENKCIKPKKVYNSQWKKS